MVANDVTRRKLIFRTVTCVRACIRAYCVRACVRAYVRAYVRACVRACVECFLIKYGFLTEYCVSRVVCLFRLCIIIIRTN